MVFCRYTVYVQYIRRNKKKIYIQGLGVNYASPLCFLLEKQLFVIPPLFLFIIYLFSSYTLSHHLYIYISKIMEDEQVFIRETKRILKQLESIIISRNQNVTITTEYIETCLY